VERIHALFYGGAMKEIPLTKGYVALIDDGMYEELSQWKWYASSDKSGPKAVRNTRPNKEGKRAIVLMHRQITCAPPGMDVHHKDHDTLNNQEENLVVCTRGQNAANMRKRIGGSSRFKGVCWREARGRWQARIMVNYCTNHLGYFDDEVEAARAYNVAALYHFKEFALLNDV
jgi:hypothetical protein